MLLFLLLLLLLVCSSQATHFFGTVMTYYPKTTSNDGNLTVVIRYKLSFRSCTDGDSWVCFTGSCGSQSAFELNIVDEENGREWCQREGIMTRQVLTNAPFEMRLDGGNWISNIVNGVIAWRALTLVELRNRSDTGQANRSPQTTILPAVRVPSNCQRDFNLLAFDPDGDKVKCRYGDASLSECNPCTPPSVLALSSSCTLSFSPTSSSNEGPYAVQLEMEDFPRQTITLTQTDGAQMMKTVNASISKIPVQFVLQVDPAVPSCTEGLFLPRFLPPTPANRAQLYTPVGQTLEIRIKAETKNSTISELLFSGPYNVNQTRSGPEEFTLRWKPSESEDGESHPMCFIVQAVDNSVKYHSELRCVIVTVGNDTSSNTNATEETPTTPPITTAVTTPAPNQNTTITPSTTTPAPNQNTTIIPSTTTPAPNQNTTIIPSTTTPATDLGTTITPSTTTPAPNQNTTIIPSTTTPATDLAVVRLTARISTLFPLTEDDIRNTIMRQVKDALVKQGLPSEVDLVLVKIL